jgi:hypothetical protein
MCFCGVASPTPLFLLGSLSLLILVLSHSLMAFPSKGDGTAAQLPVARLQANLGCLWKWCSSLSLRYCGYNTGAQGIAISHLPSCPWTVWGNVTITQTTFYIQFYL